MLRSFALNLSVVLHFSFVNIQLECSHLWRVAHISRRGKNGNALSKLIKNAANQKCGVHVCAFILSNELAFLWFIYDHYPCVENVLKVLEIYYAMTHAPCNIYIINWILRVIVSFAIIADFFLLSSYNVSVCRLKKKENCYVIFD